MCDIGHNCRKFSLKLFNSERKKEKYAVKWCNFITHINYMHIQISLEIGTIVKSLYTWKNLDIFSDTVTCDKF